MEIKYNEALVVVDSKVNELNEMHNLINQHSKIRSNKIEKILSGEKLDNMTVVNISPELGIQNFIHNGLGIKTHNALNIICDTSDKTIRDHMKETFKRIHNCSDNVVGFYSQDDVVNYFKYHTVFNVDIAYITPTAAQASRGSINYMNKRTREKHFNNFPFEIIQKGLNCPLFLIIELTGDYKDKELMDQVVSKLSTLGYNGYYDFRYNDPRNYLLPNKCPERGVIYAVQSKIDDRTFSWNKFTKNWQCDDESNDSVNSKVTYKVGSKFVDYLENEEDVSKSVYLSEGEAIKAVNNEGGSYTNRIYSVKEPNIVFAYSNIGFGTGYSPIIKTSNNNYRFLTCKEMFRLKGWEDYLADYIINGAVSDRALMRGINIGMTFPFFKELIENTIAKYYKTNYLSFKQNIINYINKNAMGTLYRINKGTIDYKLFSSKSNKSKKVNKRSNQPTLWSIYSEV